MIGRKIHAMMAEVARELKFDAIGAFLTVAAPPLGFGGG